MHIPQRKRERGREHRDRRESLLELLAARPSGAHNCVAVCVYARIDPGLCLSTYLPTDYHTYVFLYPLGSPLGPSYERRRVGDSQSTV